MSIQRKSKFCRTKEEQAKIISDEERSWVKVIFEQYRISPCTFRARAKGLNSIGIERLWRVIAKGQLRQLSRLQKENGR